MANPGIGYRTAADVLMEVSFHLAQPAVYTALTAPVTAGPAVSAAVINTYGMYPGALLVVDLPGSVATYSTNAGGEITGLSAATSVTITFANSGWTNAAFCTATPSTTLATVVYNSAQSNTAVTFTFPALTGNLFYHCDGN